MTSVLLLDVMSTLVYDPFYVEMPAFFGMSFEELMRSKHPTAWLEFESGRWSEQKFLDNFFADGRSYDQDGLKAVTYRSFRWLPGVESLLSELVAQGLPMHVVSNYPTWYHEIEARLGLSRYLPWTFVSCDWGLRKPDPQVFLRLLGHLAIAPQEAYFVDDSGANCDAAARLGVRSFRFCDAKALRQTFVDEGILSN